MAASGQTGEEGGGRATRPSTSHSVTVQSPNAGQTSAADAQGTKA
jgi:hypothetical protein